ncbi:MAG: stage III sporulation protein AB [Clostridiales bacterium]|jgi:stage III sporulation protein AB|nr:stage III sporulation protein AB [Clostridiales bacterium]
MLITRAAGAALVVGACALAGARAAFRAGFRMDELLRAKRAFMLLSSEIERGSSLRAAARLVSERVEGAIAGIFRDFYQNLGKKGGAEDTFINSLENCRLHSFGKGDMEIFRGFAKIIGVLDINAHRKNIDALLRYIDGETEILLKRRDSDKKLYLNLGLLGGLMLAAALW